MTVRCKYKKKREEKNSGRKKNQVGEKDKVVKADTIR